MSTNPSDLITSMMTQLHRDDEPILFPSFRPLANCFKVEKLTKMSSNPSDLITTKMTQLHRDDESILFPRLDRDNNNVCYNRYCCLPPSRVFFYMMACHLKPDFALLDGLRSIHYDSMTTAAIAECIFLYEGDDSALKFCFDCCNCKRDSWIDENTLTPATQMIKRPFLVNNLCRDQDTRRNLVNNFLQGTTIPNVAEEMHLTDKMLANFSDFSWSEIKAFFNFIVRRVPMCCDVFTLEDEYLRRKKERFNLGMDKNLGHSFETVEQYYPNMKQTYRYDTSVLDSFESVIELLQYVGLGENLSTFGILNKILKMHHLHFWRLLMRFSSFHTIVQSPFMDRDTTIRIAACPTNYIIFSLGPYTRTIGRTTETVRVIIGQHVLTSEIFFFLHRPTEDLGVTLRYFLRRALGKGREFNLLIVDPRDWLAPVVSQMNCEYYTVIFMQLQAPHDNSDFFLRHILDCHTADTHELCPFNVFDNLDIIIGMHNKTYFPNGKTVVSLTPMEYLDIL